MLLVLAAVLLLYLLGFVRKPVINSIEPAVGIAGDVLVIKGSALSRDELGSWVSIGGRRIASLNILEWTDSRISFRIPYNVFTGMVSVSTSNGEAEGPLFINADQIPQRKENAQKSESLSIVSISTSTPRPGELVTLRGNRFGNSMLDRQIVVSGLSIPPEDIDLWSDNEITFVFSAPYGAASIRIQGPGSASNQIQVQVLQEGVQEQRGQKASYLLELGYGIGEVEKSGDGLASITILSPRLGSDFAQQSLFQTSKGPFVRDSSPLVPVDLYTLSNLGEEPSFELQILWHLSMQSITRTINPTALPDIPVPALYAPYLRGSALVPLEDKAILSLANQVSGKKISNFEKASQLFSSVLATLEPDPSMGLAFGPEALSDGKAQSFGYANLYAALLRLAGVPARLVEGIYDPRVRVSADENPYHYWVSWFQPGIGWLEADPYLADLDKARLALFGSTDGLHLALYTECRLPLPGKLDENAYKQFGRLVLMDLHSRHRGAIESYGLRIYDPKIQSIQASIP